MNTALINEVTKDQLKNVPLIKAGMQVRVYEKVKEKDRERIQVFEGIVIAQKHGKGPQATFTVRKVVDGIGVEKTWPLHSPSIEKIEIVRAPKVRQSKLYFIRKLSPTKIRRKLSVFKSVVSEKTKLEETEEQNNEIQNETEESKE
ncbi:MAG TPA: 50S ribosomal protein L19 [Candidatus Paceibacterota bacterium]|nr:50S ribosomal protein L19 [Candidatus Paceibacterota bacterium]HOL54175.1 50S ribosomal protein L19 [Candidatus Paceibacterota bacterium]HON22102.1 50S ribosomal protein L19 [Candidatus Paceibacterota bacterium]HOV88890.1 50S ribosomal protein L19 [Candidatus Paceibacterota bacterium]HPP16888.1 50S ribosomal protein L19 [Candidatus Paceibacterota bacterium]